MNNLFGKSLISILLTLAIGCVPKFKTVIENPLFEAANSTTIAISKIELNDSATILHIDARYIPNYWIRIVSDSYIQANGEKYIITGSEGIELDTEFWMPESGQASFILKFGALPKNVKSFDFIESDCEDCFKVYGIDLTGKYSQDEYPSGLPAELCTKPIDGDLPDPVFKSANTTLNVTFLGYRKGIYKEVSLYENTMLGDQNEHNLKINEESGSGTLSFDQVGTSEIILVAGRSMVGKFMVAPGESTDVYIDLQEVAFREFAKSRSVARNNTRQSVYTTGTYSNINAFSDIYTDLLSSLRMNLYNGDIIDYKDSAEEYAAKIDSAYVSIMNKITYSENCSQMLKELASIELKIQYVQAIKDFDYLLVYNYRNANNAWDYKQPIDYKFAELKPEHEKNMIQAIDFNEPKMFICSDFMTVMPNSDLECKNLIDDDNAFVRECVKVRPMIFKANNNLLSDSDMEELKSYNSQFFAEACGMIQDGVRQKAKDLEGKFCIIPTPEVKVEKLFDEIIAKHKGKVVMVDFWNTWCGPCRGSIKAIEPWKNEEMNNDDVVWIYIANESSPLTTYQTMISEIRGEHYRINDAQWSYLCDKFNIDGIPSYVLVDKKGDYCLRNDLRDHNKYKNTIFEMIK